MTPTTVHAAAAYERKFSDFIYLLQMTREELIVVHHPEVLGDTFDEIVESLALW